MAELNPEQLAAFNKFLDKFGDAIEPKDLDAFVANIKRTTAELKKTQSGVKTFGDVLNGRRAQMVDLSATLEKLDKQYEEQIKLATEKNQVDKVAKLQAEQAEAKDAIARANFSKSTRVAGQNLLIGTLSVADGLAKGAIQFAKDLQGGASGIEAGTNAAVNAAKIAGETTSEVCGALSIVGTGLAFFGKKARLVGMALEVLGSILGITGKKATEFSGEAIKYLGEEVKKTQKAFTEVTSTGAEFAGGMTELRERAFDAGLDVNQFSKVIKDSTAELSLMGLGLAESAKRVGAVSKELRNSDLGMQLRKLGYTVEEQAELGAQVSANLNASGRLRSTSDKEVANITAQYGRDLKILADITGEDAKKAMEKARLQAMEADLLAAAYEKGGPEAVEKLQAQLATMPEAMKKGYMEFVSTGGTAIADAATNVAITQNPKIMEQYRQQYETLGNANKKQHDALIETGQLTEQTGKYAREYLENTKTIGMASRLTGDSFLGGISAINNGLILVGTKLGEGATKAAQDATDAAAKNQKPLDVAVHGVEEASQNLRVALGKETTGAITEFAGTLRKGIGTVQDSLNKLGLSTQKTTSNFDKVARLILEGGGMLAGGALGATAAGAVTVGTGGVGALAAPAMTMAGGAGGQYLGSKLADMLGFAKGGISQTSNQNGLIARVSEGGTAEAHVPLPDGKSIPVSINSPAPTGNMEFASALKDIINPIASLTDIVKKLAESSLRGSQNTLAGPLSGMSGQDQTEATNFANKNNKLLEEMVGHLRDHKDISQKLLYAGM